MREEVHMRNRGNYQGVDGELVPLVIISIVKGSSVMLVGKVQHSAGRNCGGENRTDSKSGFITNLI